MIQTISPNEDLVLDLILSDKAGNVIDSSLIANLQFVVFTQETSEMQRVYLSGSRYREQKLYVNSSELQLLHSGQLYITTAIALLNSQYNDGTFDYIKTNALPYYLNNPAMSMSDSESILNWKINVTKALQDIDSTLSGILTRLNNVEVAQGNQETIQEVLAPYATIEYVDEQDASIVASIPSLDGYATEEYVNNQDASVEANIPSIEGLATEQYVTESINAIPEVDLTPYATTEDVSVAISTIPQPDLTPYALKTSIPSLDGYATEQYVNSAVADVSVDLTGYATEQYVDEHDASVANSIPSVEGFATETFVTEQVGNIDLTPYATTEDVSTALANKADVSDIPSLDGYATEQYVNEHDASVANSIPTLEGYATENYVGEQIAAIPQPDLTPYATDASVNAALSSKADVSDIPSLEGYTTDASLNEILEDYVTDSSLSENYINKTQMENVEQTVAIAVNRLEERVENIEEALAEDSSVDASTNDSSI